MKTALDQQQYQESYNDQHRAALQCIVKIPDIAVDREPFSYEGSGESGEKSGDVYKRQAQRTEL